MSLILSQDSLPDRQLLVDLVGDFACPWSFLGTRRLSRALASLEGMGTPELRWHPFRLAKGPGADRPTWRAHLASRLPDGVATDLAEQSLREAGRDLGVEFDFDRLTRVPDTSDAHRLAKLAARENRQGDVVEAIYRAYFEQAQDIGNVKVLATIGSEAGLSDALLESFATSTEGADEVVDDERRLTLLGVTSIPNLLFNGRVLVPGPAEESTYVQAIDQALFPPPDPLRVPTLH